MVLCVVLKIGSDQPIQLVEPEIRPRTGLVKIEKIGKKLVKIEKNRSRIGLNREPAFFLVL